MKWRDSDTRAELINAVSEYLEIVESGGDPSDFLAALGPLSVEVQQIAGLESLLRVDLGVPAPSEIARGRTIFLKSIAAEKSRPRQTGRKLYGFIAAAGLGLVFGAGLASGAVPSEQLNGLAENIPFIGAEASRDKGGSTGDDKHELDSREPAAAASPLDSDKPESFEKSGDSDETRRLVAFGPHIESDNLGVFRKQPTRVVEDLGSDYAQLAQGGAMPLNVEDGNGGIPGNGADGNGGIPGNGADGNGGIPGNGADGNGGIPGNGADGNGGIPGNGADGNGGIPGNGADGNGGMPGNGADGNGGIPGNGADGNGGIPGNGADGNGGIPGNGADGNGGIPGNGANGNGSIPASDHN